MARAKLSLPVQSNSRVVHDDGSVNYDHASFARKNPCHDLFVECEGDCHDCPNKDFFRHVEIERDMKRESEYVHPDDPEPFEARFAHGGAFHDGWGCTACDDARDEPHFNVFDMMMRGNQGVL